MNTTLERNTNGRFSLIDESVVVKNLLDGKQIHKKCLYRNCYLLAKHFKQQGMSQMDIRDAIFQWGKQYGVYISYNINNIIRKAMQDKQRLRDNVIVNVSEDDIRQIVRRFDNKNVRKLALALLCYAKATANRDGEFGISSVELGAWIGIDNSNIISRYLPELIDFGYVQREESKPSFSWDKTEKYKHLSLRMLVPFNNRGGHLLRDNDINELYTECFSDEGGCVYATGL